MITYANYADRVSSDIRRDMDHRLAAHRREYGAEFVDLIYCDPNGHGPGRMGLSCEFGGYRSSAPMSLVSFARWVFGNGRLRRVGGGNYIVLRTEGE
jgi:hypothetical protein